MFGKDSGKISTTAALTMFVIGVIAIAGAAALLIFRPNLKKNDGTVQANAIPFAARLDKANGDIGIARQTGTQQDAPYQGWTKATVNSPVSLGDRIYVNDGSKAAIAINKHSYVRLNPKTSLDVVSLTDGRTQLALREGACVFDVDSVGSDETYEIGTPNGAVDFTQPGLYQVGIDDAGDTVVSVLNGAAQVTSQSGACDVTKGQFLTLAAADAADAIVSDLSPDVAGTIVDDYYSYRYPKTYDGRYSDYNAYESDPEYYDRIDRQSASYKYIPDDADIAGVEDLDDYGEWQDVPSYGHCWRPRATSSDWAPYRDGYWSDDRTLGLQWVSNEQWGWAPYHYGRWAHVDQQWYWVPTEITRRATYAPALVAFVSPRADEVGWVPLGPGDPYLPHYYDHDYQARYAGSRSEVESYVNVTNVVNYHDAGAVTVVSINQFTRVITPTTVLRPDPALFVNARLVVDPYAVPVVRQIAPTLEAARPVVAVPLDSQQSFNRPVMMRRQPVVPPSATNVAQTLKVEPVSEAAVKQKLKVKNNGQSVTTTQANGVPVVPPEAKVSQQTPQERDARIAALAVQAAQGNKSAKREMRQLEAQQQQDAIAQQKAAQQQAAAQQQQAAEQVKAEKRAARQQAQQAAQQLEQQRQAQATQRAEQTKTQKRAARQQAAQQATQQRQAQAAQRAEQAQAQKRAERQQAQQAAQQAEQQRQAQAAQQAEQQKAQKRAERQQAAQQGDQQRQAQPAQQAEQLKAQKRAARQQAQQAAQQAAQQQAQQEASRQNAQQEQRRIQKQARQQAQQQAEHTQQQRQQQKQQRRAEAQGAATQANPTKAEKRAEKAKNKNSNQ